MVLCGHQPNYIPWLGYFHKISKADTFILVDSVQYNRKLYNNRNLIKNASGAQWLTVPVLSKGNYKSQITEIEINNTVDWRRKHWNAIYLNYKKAPFFNKYSDFFNEVYKKEWVRLVDLDECIIEYLLSAFEIEVKVMRSSHIGATGKATELIVNMCKRTQATKYISGQQSRDYMDLDRMATEGLEHEFDEFVHPIYPQQFGNFISNLSSIDLLFNCGEKSRGILLGEAGRG